MRSNWFRGREEATYAKTNENFELKRLSQMNDVRESHGNSRLAINTEAVLKIKNNNNIRKKRQNVMICELE